MNIQHADSLFDTMIRHTRTMSYSISLLYLLLLSNVVSAIPRLTRSPSPPNLARRAPGLIVPPNESENHWVDSWGTMPQLIDARDLPPGPFTTPETVFANTTLRQTVRLTLGGDLLRIRISNAFGGSDLPITGVSIALPAGDVSGVSAVADRTSQRLTFGGEESIVVPMGALAVSDPVQLPTPVKATTILTLSIYSKDGQKTNSVTGHTWSWTTSWFVKGDHLDSTDLPNSGQGQAPGGEGKVGVDHWYWLSGVEVWTAKTSSAMVVIGDSITDGHGSEVNGNNRCVPSQTFPRLITLKLTTHICSWPDLFVDRLLSSADDPSLQSFSMINQAAGGNRILTHGGGPSALSRIDRDVLAHSSVTHAIIFEGVNDILSAPPDAESQSALAQRMIWAFRQIVDRLHAHNIIVFGGTIAPFSAPGSDNVDSEATRQTVNEWIRESGVFDAVVDFEKVLADPNSPDRLLNAYDTGDHLHPNVAGFQAAVDAFPMDVLDSTPRDTRESQPLFDDLVHLPLGPVTIGS